MSKRAFSRSFDMPTIDPDKEDETPADKLINIMYDKMVDEGYIKCPVAAKSGCDHDWTSYTGLSESFEFCTICDEKR